MRIFVFIFTISLSLFANNLATIKNQGKIRIGVLDYSQFQNVSQTNLRFEDLEKSLAKQIAKELLGSNLKLELIVIKAEDRISSLENNKIDLAIAGLTVTKDKKEKIEFSLPYFFGNTAVLTKRGYPLSLINLKDKILAIPTNSSAMNSVEGFDFKRVECKESKECFQLLEDDKVDGYIDDDLTLIEFTLSNDKYEIPLQKIGKSDLLAIGIAKGNNDLLNAVNKVLIQLSKNGYLEQLYNNLVEPLKSNSLIKFKLNDIYQMYE